MYMICIKMPPIKGSGSTKSHDDGSDGASRSSRSSRSGRSSKSKTKHKSISNRSTDSDTMEVLFECGTVAVTNLSNFWIYVLTREQCDVILYNFSRKRYYISAFSHSNITVSDVVLLYQVTGRTKSEPGCFVGICEIASDMVANDGTLDKHNKKNSSGIIKVYNDNNMNRYVTVVSRTYIYTEPLSTELIKDVIEGPRSDFPSMRKFKDALRGECKFVPINTLKFGQNIVRKLQKLENIQKAEADAKYKAAEAAEAAKIAEAARAELFGTISTISTIGAECDDYVENTDEIYSDNDDENADADADADTDIDVSDVADDADSDNAEADDVESGDIEEAVDENSNSSTKSVTSYVIKPNIPIMFVPCSALPKEISKLKQHHNIVKVIYDHYVHCEKCDITNNGPRELSISVKSIGIRCIKYVFDDFDDVLAAYNEDKAYPVGDTPDMPETADAHDTHDNPIEHQIVFHYIKTDPMYYDCILIAFTSQVKDVTLRNRVKHKA